MIEDSNDGAAHMTQDHGEASRITYVTQELFGRRGVWAVWTARPRTGFGEPSYRALFAVAVATGDAQGQVHRCELGWTPLNAKEPITRDASPRLP